MLEIHPCFASGFTGNSSWLCFVFVSLFPGKAVAGTAGKSMRSSTVIYFFLGTASLVTRKVMIPVCLKELEDSVSGIQRKLHFCLPSPSFPLSLNHHFI